MGVTLKAEQRKDLRGSVTKKIRKSGYVPGIVYGKDKEGTAVSVNEVELLKTVRDEGRNAIISLDIENGEKVQVMLQEYQMDPVKDDLVHVDFYIIDLTEEMDVSVPIRIEGEAEGARSGGVLQQPLFELQVRAKPNDIPEEITIDVSSMQIGDSLTIADLPKSDKYDYLEDEDIAVVTVTAPQEEEEESEADTTAEPKLVTADKDESEEDNE